MLLAVALPFFTSCSEDDDVNTAECTIGFESSEIVTSEYVTNGYLNIPITVTGKRNGPIKLTIEAAGTGEEPAVEGEHFAITDKTLNLNADTLSNGTINVEVKIIDDTGMNANRQFTLTITDVNGAEVTTNQTTVTIMNNDGYYVSLFGEWTLSAMSLVSQRQITCDVTISGTEDESDSDYENVLTAQATNLLGYGETLTWPLQYSFDSQEQSGLASIVCGTTIGQIQGTNLTFAFDPGDGYLYLDPFEGTWALGANGEPATTITYPVSSVLYAGVIQGTSFSYVDAFAYITLTRK